MDRIRNTHSCSSWVERRMRNHQQQVLWTTGEHIEEYVRGVVMIVVIKGCRGGDRDDNRDVVVMDVVEGGRSQMPSCWGVRHRKGLLMASHHGGNAMWCCDGSSR